MITRIYLLTLLFFLFSNAQSQKYYNVWAFGDKSGLNFNTEPARPFESASEGLEQSYYISSICDKDGNLQFYTDGTKLWGFNNKIIPRYLGRWPWSGYVMPLICPYPENDSLYYLFGISDGKFDHQLQYLTIKTRLGRAEIVYPQPSTLTNYFTVLLQNASVTITGTAHCNQKDTWIVAHAGGSLNSFLVTKEGVSSNPLRYAIPATIRNTPDLDVRFSNMKFSANGEKLVIPWMDENNVAVFEFNNQSGMFSNPIKVGIPSNQVLEDVELSADGSKLYVAATEQDTRDPDIHAEWHYVYQMDLNAGSAAQVEQTRVLVNWPGERVICWERGCWTLHRSMQLGPDGKIYVNMRYGDKGFDKTLSVIEFPNKNGAESKYKRGALNTNRLYRYINYNYIRSASFSLKENGIQVQKKVCADRPVEFSLLFSKVDSVKWNFGDPPSGNQNISTSFTPQHTYPAPGSYTVSAVIYKNCLVDTARTIVTIQTDKAVHVLDFLKDTTVCIGNELELNATAPFTKTYTWENGLIYPNRIIKDSGVYAITIANECSSDSRIFKVVFEECHCNVFVPSAFTPNNDGLNDRFAPGVQCASVKDFQFQVFNRYGNVVYRSAEPYKGWDGKIGNQEAPSGVYVWMLEYRNPNNKQVFKQKGTVVLIR